MEIVNIEDPATGRQANNVLANAIVGAVRPWFDDVKDSHVVNDALTLLSSPAAEDREKATRALGIHVIPVA